MLVTFLRTILVCFAILIFSIPLFAQTSAGSSGSSGGSASGGSSGSGSGGYTSSGGSGYTSSGSTSSGSSLSGSSSGADIISQFQGPELERNEFIGVDPSAKFIGRDNTFVGSSSSSSSSSSSTRRTTTARTTTSARRTATASRTTSRAGSNSIITNAGRAITATASFESGELVSVNNARDNFTKFQTEIKTRILRLPNLDLQSERFNISLVNTSSGVVAELTGIVDSERTSKILKQLLLLEPGINNVKNNLTIEPRTK
ncbi:MAG: hypothetical protein LBE18_09165 [Planctomycetaceae bacterium]|jgi:hypothetical protein|nr:hypothetical protein [Planctomycetaceae bacterium]